MLAQSTSATNPVKAKRIVSPATAAQMLANYKKQRSWCVDMTGNFPILMHALSDRTASLQDIRLEFTQWAKDQNIRVDCANYEAFLLTLPDRVMSLMPRVYGKGMRPNSDRFIVDDSGIMLANIYNPAVMSAPLPVPAPYNKMVDLFGQLLPEILAEMLERVFPIENERRFMVQRMAAMIQTPERRAKHAVFLVGAGGTGKSSTLDILETTMHRRHVDRSQSYKSANDCHSEAFCNNRLVAFEDKPIGSGGEEYNYTMLKQVIDYDRRTVNIKHGQRAVQREVNSNIVITTNNKNLFPWDGNERRFFIPQYITHLHNEEESGQFFARFHAFLQLPGMADVLHHWLMNVDMEGFDYGRCPRTPQLLELIAQTGTMLDKYLNDFLDGCEIFHPKKLAVYLADQKQTYKGKELKEALELRGYEYERMKFKCDGLEDARFRVWRKRPPPGRHFRDLTQEERFDLMEIDRGR
jgi:hypothetical protein